MTEFIGERARFDFIRYANCWEDAAILCEALRARPGSRILSIASGGDNCFSLLARGATVIAADLNPAQLACVELKRAAILRLDRNDVLGFFGFTDSADRLRAYRDLAPALPQSARTFWDAHTADLDAGFVHAGKFEDYFRRFRTKVLPWVHSQCTVETLWTERTREERVKFYEATWNNVRWRLMFQIFFSRFVMGRLGRDPEFFRFVEGSVADRILDRTRYAFTELPTHTNPYLEYILTGTMRRTVPDYLEPHRYEALRRGMSELTLHQGTIEEAARADMARKFDGFNLSDIFEYLPPDLCTRIYGELLDRAAPGARFAYWNMLVPRTCPEPFRSRVKSLDDEASALFLRDRAFFYSAFRVEEVR